MRNKLGNLCMLLGAALVFCALTLFSYNQREASAAEQSVQVLLPQVQQQIQKRQEVSAVLPGTPAELLTPEDVQMTEVVIDGYAYIGYLSIPALALELPVMSQWDYERLKTAPCRYAGSTKSDDLVLLAHNYAKHFGTLKNLVPGDAVYFTDMDEEISRYEVVLVEILPPEAVEEMVAGEYDLTLVTCTYGGENRVTIRCDRVKD